MSSRHKLIEMEGEGGEKMDVNSCRNPMRVSCDFVQNLLLVKTCNFQAAYITYNNHLLALKDVQTNGNVKIPSGGIPDNQTSFFMG